MTDYLVCYDISSNTKRGKVARLLEDAGERVQLSVFHVNLRPDGMKTLREKMRRLIEEGDELLVVPLCGACMAGALRAGPPIPVCCVA